MVKISCQQVFVLTFIKPFNCWHTEKRFAAKIKKSFFLERYHETYGDTSDATGVSITLNTEWFEPLDPESPEHWDAADRYIQSEFGWFAHPIYVNGDYPELMKG